MKSYFMEFRNKEIINITTGVKIGYVDDIIFDVETSKIISVVVYGRMKFFGLFGRDEDINIDWENIKTIGEDTILVSQDIDYITEKSTKRVKIFDKLLF